jgi:hypothetical protein
MCHELQSSFYCFTNFDTHVCKFALNYAVFSQDLFIVSLSFILVSIISLLTLLYLFRVMLLNDVILNEYIMILN